MTPASAVPPHPAGTPLPPAPALLLRSFTCDDRSTVLRALAEEMTACGCWLLDRKALSISQMEYTFEVQLRTAFDLYCGLIATGLELTRSSHLDLTALCTLRKHLGRSAALGRVLAVQLEITFLGDPEPTLPAPLSFA